VARRSLAERAKDRAERKAAANDPNGQDKLWRYATARFEGASPIDALLLSDIAIRPAPGPLSAEERAELQAMADAVEQDPRVVHFNGLLNRPASETLEKGATIAAANQVRKSQRAYSERTGLQAAQDVMNRGGLPTTTVQRVETTPDLTQDPNQLADELQQHADRLRAGSKRVQN